jgi:hypothetical protein
VVEEIVDVGPILVLRKAMLQTGVKWWLSYVPVKLDHDTFLDVESHLQRLIKDYRWMVVLQRVRLAADCYQRLSMPTPYRD